MAAQKKEKEQPESVPEALSEPQKEKLLKFRAISTFSDGNLREQMERYGYDVEWRMETVRALPAWLIKRCIQSGAELEPARDG